MGMTSEDRTWNVDRHRAKVTFDRKPCAAHNSARGFVTQRTKVHVAVDRSVHARKNTERGSRGVECAYKFSEATRNAAKFLREERVGCEVNLEHVWQCT